MKNFASLTLPDPGDRHVLAAAIHANAEVILTCNLADFPAETLARSNIEAQHPDDFLVYLLGQAPGVVAPLSNANGRASAIRPRLHRNCSLPWKATVFRRRLRSYATLRTSLDAIAGNAGANPRGKTEACC